jgi:hypothetical protein
VVVAGATAAKLDLELDLSHVRGVRGASVAPGQEKPRRAASETNVGDLGDASPSFVGHIILNGGARRD